MADVEGSGLHSQALRENPGETEDSWTRLLCQPRITCCISPVQQRVQDAMRKKRAKAQWRRETKGRADKRIENAIAKFRESVEAARKAFQVAQEEYESARKRAKKNKEDPEIMSEYKRKRRAMKERERDVAQAQAKVDKAVMERDNRQRRQNAEETSMD